MSPAQLPVPGELGVAATGARVCTSHSKVTPCSASPGDLSCSRKWVRPTAAMVLGHPGQVLVAASWQGVPETQLVGLQVLTRPGTWCDVVAGTLRQG